ncbi:glucose-6-phosphate dehydrogenase [Tepidimonas taiwanensis]|uniref:glucose-6-phosphate dehydrogenase n=1 Tax=Tepidimonas taiwanensis TaxID=307486 RepID=UPI0007348D05|nr:glucose-6-phosphate dehydrogenase [Tepidimonas taiwanensis]
MTDTDPAMTDIVIFGGSGDLAWRKLIPALYMADLHGRLPEDTRILGLGRQPWSTQQYAAFLTQHSAPLLREQGDDERWHRFLQRIQYVALDANDANGYAVLGPLLRPPATRVYYLATAPALFAAICQHLDTAGLITPQSRVVLEKPLGHDLPTAQAINAAVAQHFAEHQIFRIDHYLGKETVQNLMVLRFGNAIFEPIWRAPYIRSVQITVAETVGVGNRAGFYDQTGALRDMVQNHLLQLLCIVAMEPPLSLEPDDVRDEKLKVLRSLPRMDLPTIRTHTVRGQYTAGAVEGQSVSGYLEEPGVPADSQTETFVALQTQVRNARWAGVPFFLRTGKRMATRRSQIVIDFAPLPFSIFGHSGDAIVNRLILTLQPEESVQLQMMAKEPGSGMNTKPVYLNLDLESALEGRRAEAYERLLIDVIKGRLTHFMRRDELEAAWRFIDPILEGWRALGEKPRPYTAGTWGPAASSALMARAGCSWFEES